MSGFFRIRCTFRRTVNGCDVNRLLERVIGHFPDDCSETVILKVRKKTLFLRLFDLPIIGMRCVKEDENFRVQKKFKY